MDSLNIRRFGTVLGRLLVAVLAVLILGVLTALPALAAGSGTWTLTGSLNVARADFTTTLLQNGQILVVGGRNSNYTPLASAELYNPSTSTWTTTGSLHTARYDHTATLLQNGQVLVAGGYWMDRSTYTKVPLASAELYNPTTGTWMTTGSLHTARVQHTATLLQNGQVLVAAGYNQNNSPPYLASAELYNPATGTWTTTGSLSTARVYHTMTLLNNGQVLVAGGYRNDPLKGAVALASAELYNPSTGKWTYTGSLHTARWSHSATLLQNGEVLVAGGESFGSGGTTNVFASAELYNPSTGKWTTTGSLNQARYEQAETLLQNGQVLVAGGNTGVFVGLSSAELYNPSTGKWTTTGSMTTVRRGNTMTLLQNGQVLVAGGQMARAIFLRARNSTIRLQGPGR